MPYDYLLATAFRDVGLVLLAVWLVYGRWWWELRLTLFLATAFVTFCQMIVPINLSNVYAALGGPQSNYILPRCREVVMFSLGTPFLPLTAVLGAYIYERRASRPLLPLPWKQQISMARFYLLPAWVLILAMLMVAATPFEDFWRDYGETWLEFMSWKGAWSGGVAIKMFFLVALNRIFLTCIGLAYFWAVCLYKFDELLKPVVAIFAVGTAVQLLLPYYSQAFFPFARTTHLYWLMLFNALLLGSMLLMKQLDFDEGLFAVRFNKKQRSKTEPLRDLSGTT